ARARALFGGDVRAALRDLADAGRRPHVVDNRVELVRPGVDDDRADAIEHDLRATARLALTIERACANVPIAAALASCEDGWRALAIGRIARARGEAAGA